LVSRYVVSFLLLVFGIFFNQQVVKYYLIPTKQGYTVFIKT